MPEAVPSQKRGLTPGATLPLEILERLQDKRNERARPPDQNNTCDPFWTGHSSNRFPRKNKTIRKTKIVDNFFLSFYLFCRKPDPPTNRDDLFIFSSFVNEHGRRRRDRMSISPGLCTTPGKARERYVCAVYFIFRDDPKSKPSAKLTSDARSICRCRHPSQLWLLPEPSARMPRSVALAINYTANPAWRGSQ